MSDGKLFYFTHLHGGKKLLVSEQTVDTLMKGDEANRKVLYGFGETDPSKLRVIGTIVSLDTDGGVMAVCITDRDAENELMAVMGSTYPEMKLPVYRLYGRGIPIRDDAIDVTDITGAVLDVVPIVNNRALYAKNDEIALDPAGVVEVQDKNSWAFWAILIFVILIGYAAATYMWYPAFGNLAKYLYGLVTGIFIGCMLCGATSDDTTKKRRD